MKYEPLVSLENVNFEYVEGNPVLSNINLEIKEGEKILIVGPSGCGKSTLGLIIAALIPEHVYGKFAGGAYYRPDIAQKVGIVFQDPESQFVTFRVIDEVAFGPENLGFKPSKIMKVVRKSLEFVNMLHKKYDLISELSGGEKQRIALASVVAMEPELVILDEPTAMLDPAATEHFLSYIPKLNSKGLVIIEHKIDSLLEAIDRVIAMSPNGTIAFSGTVSEVFVGHFDELIANGTSVPRVILILKEFEKRGLLELASSQFIPSPRSIIRKLVTTGIADKIARIEWNFEVQKRSSDNDIILRAKDLVYTYPNGMRAVNNASIEIKEGEIVAVVGRNGSGKTTLMDLIAGIKTPDSGEIEFLGKRIEEYPPDEFFSMVGYVFQNPEHQFVMPTVFDEIAFEFRKLGLSEKEVRYRTMELLERLLLADKAHKNPFRLSQGEKRRLSLGTALVGNRKLLILDEPTFGQDRRAALNLIQLGKELSAQGTAMLIVTHDVDVAFEECNRIVVMSMGEIIWDGMPHELVSKDDIMSLSGLRLPTVAKVSKEISQIVHGFPMLINLSQWRQVAAKLQEMEVGN